MRIVIARQNHETNTFSPVPTPLAAFRPIYGDAALAEAQGMKTALGAFHAYAQGLGAEVVCPLIAHAWPSAPVQDAAFDSMAEVILAEIRKGCDLILLDLHGAMVTQSHDDGEGELLSRIRAVAPDVPIGVALDLHGNLTQRIIENCDVLAGFKTYPHVDMYETGELVCHMIERIRTSGERPAMALVQPPMLPHTLRMNTEVPGPMLDIINLARAAETRPGVQAVSFFGGFPAADIAQAGISIVAVTDRGTDPAPIAQDIADAAWQRRADFIYDQKPLVQSLHDAMSSAVGANAPVLMLDHGDNCMSGGTCDNMDVFEAALTAGMSNIVTGPIHDPAAVAAAFAAGEGAEVTINVGNKIATPGFPAPHASLPLSGRITALGNGAYTISGPIYTGMLCQMGRAAVIETATARVLITEETHEPWDTAVFTSVGIDPLDCKYLLLKSRMYCRPVFEPLAHSVVECAGGGVTGSDYSMFPFQKLRRPIFPIETDTRWAQADG